MITEQDINQIYKLLNKNHPNAKKVSVKLQFGSDTDLDVKVID